jgi:hypothetical protein
LIEVEFLVKHAANQAPAILCAILAKFRLDDPEIVFVDATNDAYILQEAFPTEKTAFDDTFSVTTKAGKSTCRFKISSQSAVRSIPLNLACGTYSSTVQSLVQEICSSGQENLPRHDGFLGECAPLVHKHQCVLL